MSIPQSGGGPIERYEQMAEYLASGCKPKEDWRIGTEHEKFGFCKDSLLPLPYEGERSIHAVLSALRDRHDWQELREGNKLIGLTKDGANISLEPGGALELSGAPLETIHETCDEVNVHLKEVKDIADEIGVGFIGLGAAPTWMHEQMPLMPKGRYKLMDAYMGKVGTMGRTMMRRTSTVQVNLDYSSEADMIQKLRVGIALQPVAVALFANSPFFEGKPNGHKSWRSRVWRDTDNARAGMIPFVFDDDFGFERWVEYALDVPMYFVYRDGKYIDALGQSFRDFLDGKLPALPGEKPTLSDWADHLTTAFPEARIKKYIEMLQRIHQVDEHINPQSWILSHPQYFFFQSLDIDQKNIKIIRIENKTEMDFFSDQTGFNLQKKANNTSAIKEEINLKGKYLKIINDIYAEDFVNLGYSMLKK